MTVAWLSKLRAASEGCLMRKVEVQKLSFQFTSVNGLTVERDAQAAFDFRETRRDTTVSKESAGFEVTAN